MKFNVYLDVF